MPPSWVKLAAFIIDIDNSPYHYHHPAFLFRHLLVFQDITLLLPVKCNDLL